MELLTRYILKRYFVAAAGLALLLCFLGWLVQLLRAVDLVTNKGQGIATMVSQSFLSIPEVLNVVLFICVALGISRSIRELQLSKEIFPIYAGFGLRPLAKSLAVFVLVAITLALALSHIVVPHAKYLAALKSDQVNADLVANSSRPGKFTEISNGLTMMIRSRAADGTGLGFFVYDTRDKDRSQTIVAERSQLAQVGDILTIRLNNGVIQYFNYDSKKVSGLEFDTYSLALTDLSGSASAKNITPNTLVMFGSADAKPLSQNDWLTLHIRTVGALYVLGMAVLAFLMVARPRPMRGKGRINVDFFILAIAVFVKVAGTALEQFVVRDPGLWALIYLPASLPILVALPYAWRQGLLTRFNFTKAVAA